MQKILCRGTIKLSKLKGEAHVENLIIRPMAEPDVEAFAQGFAAQGWEPKPEIHRKYLREQAEGCRQIFVAEWQGSPAGYLTVVPEAETGPFAHMGLPEIVDFNVLEKFQRHGIGRRLMDAAEAAAAEASDVVTIGVGLHKGYGPAQRLYVKRGYIPDGCGVWFRDLPLAPYADCFTDYGLVLYLSKKLK